MTEQIRALTRFLLLQTAYSTNYKNHVGFQNPPVATFPTEACGNNSNDEAVCSAEVPTRINLSQQGATVTCAHLLTENEAPYVGYAREITLSSGETRTIRTLSQKPYVWLVEGLLSEREVASLNGDSGQLHSDSTNSNYDAVVGESKLNHKFTESAISVQKSTWTALMKDRRKTWKLAAQKGFLLAFGRMFGDNQVTAVKSRVKTYKKFLAKFLKNKKSGLEKDQILIAFREIFDVPFLNTKQAGEIFGVLDSNRDKIVTVDEWCCREYGSIGRSGKSDDIMSVSSEENDVVLSKKWNRIADLLEKFTTGENRWRQSRYSETSALHEYEGSIARKISEVLGLGGVDVASEATKLKPKNTFGESLQILRYKEKGHFVCHYDSKTEDRGFSFDNNSSDSVATDLTSTENPRVYSVLIQMSEDAGDSNERIHQNQNSSDFYSGSTWFPLSSISSENKAQYTPEMFQMLKQYCTSVGTADEAWRALSTNSRSGTDVAASKKTPILTDARGLTIKMQKGDVLIWLNHEISTSSHNTSAPTTEPVNIKIGPRDLTSLHAGLMVEKGEKWVGTQWVRAQNILETCNGR